MPKRYKKSPVSPEGFMHKKLRTFLAEGYAETAGEAIKITREFEELDNEAARYID